MKTLEVTLPRVMKFEGGNKQMLNISLHVQFHYNQYKLVKAVDQTKLKIPVSVMNAWDTTINAETDLVEQSSASERTAQMLALDNERDHLLDGIFHVVRGMRYSPTEATSEAALRLYMKLKPYADLRNRPYEMESVGIRGLENDMKTKTADIAAIGLTDAFTRLYAANEEYEKLRTDRRNDVMDAKIPAAQRVRPLTDAAYDVVCQYIQSAYLNATTDDEKAMIEQLVDRMNKVVIDIKGTQRQILASRKPKAPKDPKQPKDPKAPKDPKQPKDPKKPGGGDDIHEPSEPPKKPGDTEQPTPKPGGGSGSGDDIQIPSEPPKKPDGQ